MPGTESTTEPFERERMLIDRPVNFGRGFRMRCVNCSSINWLSAEDYVTSPESMTVCNRCGDNFNFGPAVIALTDSEDPALDDAALPELAWYHTTTDPEWPRTRKPLADDVLQHLRERARWSEERIERYRIPRENQAIHLGTYEAAIDSLLRRMRNEGDQDSAFYLHRVRLRPDLVIEQGWRDENSAAAAKITNFDLANDGVDGIRYLNAYEAIGSLSLAVVREAIESTQCVALPVSELVSPHDKQTLIQLRSLRDEVRATVAKHSEDALTPLDKLRQKHMHLAYQSAKPLAPPEAYDDIRKIEQFAADLYFKDLSPVARDALLRSLKSPRPEDSYEQDRAWLEKFIGLAALLTQPDAVQEIVRNRPWRQIHPHRPSRLSSPPLR
ncbi:hypothetical protein [Arthrobacter sp. MMS24-S77]